jgi:molybdate transport system ATP-binding protein
MAVEIENKQGVATASHHATPDEALWVVIRKQATSSAFVLDVDFAIPRGINILFGPSGAGKTTLLDCVAGLAQPDAGKIQITGRTVFDSSANINLQPRSRNAGYVFQDLALFPHLSAQKNIEFGLQRLPSGERHARVDRILQSFGISHLRRRKPREISGGEKQRVALARALVTNPSVLLLDEPLAALDPATKSRIMEDLRAWNDQQRIPILYVTHSRDEVFALGERLLILENGRLIAQGTPHEVLTAPRQETVAQLAGFENIFPATVTAIHEERGTMTCRLAAGQLEIETPLVRAEVGTNLRVGISAGDVLLAVAAPVGLSARNVIRGRLVSLAQHDVIILAKVDCGVEIAVHLTLAARDSLDLRPGREVWLIVKTHSCHLMSS